MKLPSDTLKSVYLARGQAEMQAFTSYLKKRWYNAQEKHYETK